jgi:hypothetical protein
VSEKAPNEHVCQGVFSLIVLQNRVILKSLSTQNYSTISLNISVSKNFGVKYKRNVIELSLVRLPVIGLDVNIGVPKTCTPLV